MATKKWYQSKAVIGGTLVVLGGVGSYFLSDYKGFMDLVWSVGLGLGVIGNRLATTDIA